MSGTFRKVKMKGNENLDNIFNTIIASMSFRFRMILSSYSPWTLPPRNWPCFAHLFFFFFLLRNSFLNSTRYSPLLCLLGAKKLYCSFFLIFFVGPFFCTKQPLHQFLKKNKLPTPKIISDTPKMT